MGPLDTCESTASVSAAYGSSTRRRGGGIVRGRTPQECSPPDRVFSATAGRLKLSKGSKFTAGTRASRRRRLARRTGRRRGGAGAGLFVEGHLRTVSSCVCC
ncbi:hypothetical protein THAOC_05159 [Thalassiosira oceanica]|uniref:Uncharacterized protein n=1 Tax=Thalassiosira oceanica TaxID=159749 RepID=K0T6G5_THAOC|nr:hypothetical protein THAOC_05159 [Thalassiosira oceanica]|eukprot:EJK73230.1 hypothetical protein THAOC_05159 [Thalassiosira oceanica]